MCALFNAFSSVGEIRTPAYGSFQDGGVWTLCVKQLLKTTEDQARKGDAQTRHGKDLRREYGGEPSLDASIRALRPETGTGGAWPSGMADGLST